jgi:hypothetical protein
MKSLKFIAIVVIITIATIVASYYTGYNRGYNRGYSKVITDVTCDTIVKVDTIVREKPVVWTQRIVDTMLVAVRDTIHHLDTAFIALPRTEKIYADSAYTAKISGYGSSLDYIEVYPRTMTIYETKMVYKDIRRWSFGISAGASGLVDLKGEAHWGIGATVGISYRF